VKRIGFLFLVLLIWSSWTSLQAKEWDPRLIQAMELSFSGFPENAEPLIQTYVKEKPLDPNGLFILAMVLEWKYGLSGRNHHRAYLDLEKIYKQANRMAFHLWEKNPEDVNALINLGNSYFLLARIYAKRGSILKAGLTGKKSQKHLQKALEKDSSRLDALVAVGAFNYFAGKTPKFWEPIKRMFGIKGDKDQGLAQLQRAGTGNHPYAWNAKYALLEIYSNPEKKYQKAMGILADFEEAFPQNPVVPLKRAWILEKQEPLRGARAYLDFAENCSVKYASCQPKLKTFAYSQAGKVFLEAGKYLEAQHWLVKSLEVDPKNYPDLTAKIYLWQGEAAKNGGQATTALNYYQQAAQVPGVSKKIAREVKKTRREACRQKEFSGKC